MSNASLPTAFQFSEPKSLVHVGPPDVELPHKDFSRVKRYRENHPERAIFIIVWDQADFDRCQAGVADVSNVDLILWLDDEKLLDDLTKRVESLIGAQIVGPGWYVCLKQHVIPSTKGPPLEKCPECGEAVGYFRDFEERTKSFADVFGRVATLITFDGTSGEWLKQQVNPTRNVLLNMPYALGTEEHPAYSTKDIWDSAKGKVAFALGAGPSLEDAIPHLKRLQGAGPIVSVARNFKMLHAAGIKVDYIVSCEMFDWDSIILEGVTPEMAKDTVLCFPVVCAPATVRKWPGRKLCLWDIQTAELLGRKDYIMGGNSVAHHCLNMACEYLNADAVILVGVDLGYPKPKTHADGTFHKFSDQAVEQDTNFQTEDWGPVNGPGPYHPDCHKILGSFVGGGPAFTGPIQVRTSPAYKNFGTLFSILISRHGKKVLNASGAGLMIAGAPYVDLAAWDGKMETLEAAVTPQRIYAETRALLQPMRVLQKESPDVASRGLVPIGEPSAPSLPES